MQNVPANNTPDNKPDGAGRLKSYAEVGVSWVGQTRASIPSLSLSLSLSLSGLAEKEDDEEEERGREEKEEAEVEKEAKGQRGSARPYLRERDLTGDRVRVSRQR